LAGAAEPSVLGLIEEDLAKVREVATGTDDMILGLLGRLLPEAATSDEEVYPP